jgi:hypothetical protein
LISIKTSIILLSFQASWRGYILRKKLLAALEYAQCDFDDDENDDDAMDFGDEFDLDKFVDIDEVMIDLYGGLTPMDNQSIIPITSKGHIQHLLNNGAILLIPTL